MLRKTPLRRTPIKRSRSKRRAKSDRAAKSGLRDFALEFPFCWCCRAWEGAVRSDGSIVRLETHHMNKRRGKDKHDRRGLLRACNRCHETRYTNPQDKKSELDRLAEQLGYKLAYDPDFFSREYLLEVRGFALTAITEGEVWRQAKLIKENSDG